MKIKTILVLSFVLFNLTLFSQNTCTSNGGNNWNTAFNCSGSGSPFVYVIQSTDSVYCDVNGTSNIDTIKVYGVLDFKNGSKIDLSSGGMIQVFPGGTVIGGNSGTKFRFANGTTITGPFNVSGPAYSAGSSTFTLGAVPVEWLSIGLEQNDGQSILQWSTASERNNSHFVIQAYTEAGHYEDLAMVPSLSSNGYSTSILEYSHDITALVRPDHRILRLMQVDHDGAQDFSPLIHIDHDRSAIQISQRSDLVQLRSQELGVQKLRLFSLSGKLILQEEFNSYYELNLPFKGAFLLQIEGSHGLFNRRLINY